MCRSWHRTSRPGPLWTALVLTDWCSAYSDDALAVHGSSASQCSALHKWLQHHAPQLQQLHCAANDDIWRQARHQHNSLHCNSLQHATHLRPNGCLDGLHAHLPAISSHTRSGGPLLWCVQVANAIFGSQPVAALPALKVCKARLQIRRSHAQHACCPALLPCMAAFGQLYRNMIS